MPIGTFDLAVVGHFSIDSLKLPNNPNPYIILGGAVAYVSLAARRLDAKVCIISKVGQDFSDTYTLQMNNAGVDTSNIIKTKIAHTTSFELTYNNDLSDRTLKLRHQNSTITTEDLPKKLRAKVIHIAPIGNEITFDVIKQLKKSANYLSIDPQGMARQFNNDGNVTSTTKIDERILPMINIYKSSINEITILTGKSDPNKAINAVHELGPEIVIATMGIKGSLLSIKGKTFLIPACKSRRVVDPTGAGDVFIGGFLVEYMRKKDPLWCACVGSAAASLVIEDVGTSFFGEKEEIYQRAKTIYRKEIKQ